MPQCPCLDYYVHKEQLLVSGDMGSLFILTVLSASFSFFLEFFISSLLSSSSSVPTTSQKTMGPEGLHGVFWQHSAAYKQLAVLCGNSYIYILLYELMVLLKFADIATECFNLIKSTEEIHRPISLWNIPFLE